jgi:Cu-Zn family superoxide dismutase
LIANGLDQFLILINNLILFQVCGSSGPHFNPQNKTHGDISAAVRHVGDYGNIVADSNGNIVVTFNDTVSKLYGPMGIIGRTIVLHQDQDDLGLGNNTGSFTTGNAGARVACGVIGILNN